MNSRPFVGPPAPAEPLSGAAPAASAVTMSIAPATARSKPLTCYGDRFDPALGLWSHPDLTHQAVSPLLAKLPRAHSLPRNAARLVVAAQLGRLQEEPLDSVLAGLRRLQCTDGSAKHGNFAWWAEEGRVTDTNAAFFVGLNLCVLRIRYASDLNPAQREFIDAMVRDLDRWFTHAVEERSFHYPNKYLGDLVCAWLLREILGAPPPPVLMEAIADAAAYWVEGGWGWGEHLSDIYSGVMFNQLGALLLLARHLPSPVRAHFVRLFGELVRLDRAFTDGPRVPAIRSYAFTARAEPGTFLNRVRKWNDWPDTLRRGDSPVVHFGYDHFFAENNLLSLAPPAPPPGAYREISVPCLHGSRAVAAVTPRHRIGSITRFPLIPEAEFITWGLSWQSFPVAFTAGEKGWGFLRWRSLENGVEVGHPSIRRDLDKALSRSTKPALHGLTECRQVGGRVIALRRMPRIATAWEYLVDAIELLDFQPKNIQVRSLPDGGHVLTFSHEGQTWTFGHHPLVSGARPELVTHEHGPAWRVKWDSAALSVVTPRIAHLWWLAPGAQPDATVTRLPQKGPYLLSEENDSLWRIDWPTRADDSAAGTPPWTLRFDLRLPLGEAILDKHG